MKIAVCDDEQAIREQIGALLEKMEIAPNAEPGRGAGATEPARGGGEKETARPARGETPEILLFSGGEELLAADVLSFDMIFLDIEMDGCSGLAAAEQIRKRQRDIKKDIWGSLPLIIFVTGYREHMPEAFAVHAFGYVVKPIDEKTFEKLYLEAVSECGKQKCAARDVYIKNGDKLQKIPLNDILYIESSGRKNVIHTVKGEISYYGALRAIELELPSWFFRIHKGYIVNMKMIEQYSRSQMRLADGSTVLISKYRYADFVTAYMEFLR